MNSAWNEPDLEYLPIIQPPFCNSKRSTSLKNTHQLVKRFGTLPKVPDSGIPLKGAHSDFDRSKFVLDCWVTSVLITSAKNRIILHQHWLELISSPTNFDISTQQHHNPRLLWFPCADALPDPYGESAIAALLGCYPDEWNDSLQMTCTAKKRRN